MVLPNGPNFGVGSEIAITCNVGGFPVPLVKWYKNDVEIVADSRIQITGELLSIVYLRKISFIADFE